MDQNSERDTHSSEEKNQIDTVSTPQGQTKLEKQINATEENSEGAGGSLSSLESPGPGKSLQEESMQDTEESSPGRDTEDAPTLLSEKEENSGDKSRPTHGEDRQDTPAGPCAHIFNGLSYVGLPLLILLSAALTFWGVWHVRDLWFSDEVRIADVLMNLKNGGWLILTQNGLPYTDTPPLYFWLMEALSWIPGITAVMAMFLASALSHALFIASVWLLARGTGHDRRVAFASGLIILGCLLIDGLASYVRMDLCFVAAINLGMLCLYRGACKTSAPLWLLSGFLLLAAATLIKGPFGIALAISVSILFLCWRGTPGRLGGRDGFPGFLFMLLVIAGWLGYLYMTGNQDYVRDIIGVQVAGCVQEGGRPAGPWWYYLPATALAWLPWTLLLLFINWLDAARGLHRVWKERKDRGGDAWLWLWILCGIAILSAVHAKLVINMLPLAAPLAVLTARSLLRLSPTRSRGFFCLCAVFLAIFGLALVTVDAYPLLKEFAPAGWLPALPSAAEAWIGRVEGCIFTGSTLIVVAVLLLLFVRTSRPDGALLAMSFGLAAVMAPYFYFTVPSLNSLLSPRTQAVAMAEMSKTGYAAAAYRVYPGVYAWHFNALSENRNTPRTAIPVLNTPEDRAAWISSHPKTTMAMPLAEWEAWQDRPVNSSTIASSWMAGSQYIVAALNTEPESPAAQPQTKAPDAITPALSETTPPQTSDSQIPATTDNASQALKELASPEAQERPSSDILKNDVQGQTPAVPSSDASNAQNLQNASRPAQDVPDSAGQAIKELTSPEAQDQLPSGVQKPDGPKASPAAPPADAADAQASQNAAASEHNAPDNADQTL